MARAIARLRRTLTRQRARARELLATRAADGPYRFLVRSWVDLGEVVFARRVVTTEYFTTQLEPVALPVDAPGPILLLAPHQDDEIIGAGGLLVRAARAGRAVHVVYATDGKQLKPNATPEQRSERRAVEAAQVCGELGATLHTLCIDNIAPRPTAATVERLRDVLAGVRPSVILVPWLLDQPPKHRLVTHLLALALRDSSLAAAAAAEVWQYQVHGEIFPNGYVDITDVVDEKQRLLRLYPSQIDEVQAYDHVTRGRDAWNSRYLPTGPRARFAELYFTLPAAELPGLIASTYERDLTATYRGDRGLAAAVAAIERAGNRL